MQIKAYCCNYSAHTPQFLGNNYSMIQDQAGVPSASELHAVNPDFKDLVYVISDSIAIWNSPDGTAAHQTNVHTDDYNLALANGWLLRDAGGNIIESTGNVWIDTASPDWGNTGFQQWIAQRIANAINNGNYDGVFFDNSAKAVGWMIGGINPRTGGTWQDYETAAACIALNQAVRNAIGPSKILICNGVWNGAVFYSNVTTWNDVFANAGANGFMYEGLFMDDSSNSWNGNDQWANITNWQASVDAMAWFYLHYPNLWAVDVSNFYISSGGSFDYEIGSMLLGVSGISYLLAQGGPTTLDGPVTSQLAWANALGNPLGPYTVSGYDYSRQFENGSITVNPYYHTCVYSGGPPPPPPPPPSKINIFNKDWTIRDGDWNVS